MLGLSVSHRLDLPYNTALVLWVPSTSYAVVGTRLHTSHNPLNLNLCFMGPQFDVLKSQPHITPRLPIDAKLSQTHSSFLLFLLSRIVNKVLNRTILFFKVGSFLILPLFILCDVKLPCTVALKGI